MVASTQIVRDGIARQISAWSGYRVTLGNAPEIKIWPSFRAVLNNVTLAQRGGNETLPAIEAERIEIDLSALSALRGKVTFTKLRLIRPTVRMASTGGAFLVAASYGNGRLARAVEKAKALIAADPSAPDASALPSDSLATIEIQDGRIVETDGGRQTEVLTGLAATLDWPALNRAATLTASGIWHGETMSVTAQSGQPLFLLAGGTTPATLSLKSAPLNVVFDGVASLSGDSFADGQLTFSSPSLKRMLEWAHADMTPGDTIGAIEVSCKVSGTSNRLKFEKAQLKLDGNAGMGVFDVSFGQSPPGITGTLAFDTLDLEPLVAAFTRLPEGQRNAESNIETAIASDFDIDLRVSAASATDGQIMLSNVAATAQVKDGLTAFDISDAKAFGGTVQFGMRVDRKARANLVEVRASADDIDGAQLTSRLAWAKPIPQARGSLSLILKGTGSSWERVLDTADGSVSASFGKGVLPGLNLDAFLARSSKGGFFPLSQVFGKSVAIDSAELKATIEDGVVKIDKAEAKSAKKTISLGGLMPFRRSRSRLVWYDLADCGSRHEGRGSADVRYQVLRWRNLGSAVHLAGFAGTAARLTKRWPDLCTATRSAGLYSTPWLKRSRYAGRTSRLHQLSGRPPPSTRRTSSAAPMPILSMLSCVMPAICGVRITFPNSK